MSSRILPCLLAIFFVFICGCQGGKSKGADCDANAQPPYNQCAAPAASGCDVGFSNVNGSCKPNSLACPLGEHEANKVCVKDQLNISLVNKSACWIPETGAARVIVEYTAKDESGRNLVLTSTSMQDNKTLQANFFVDNHPLDTESLLNTDSQLLNSNLVLSLVLDASYSMLESTPSSPPAFEPMKQAAMNIVKETQNLWTQTGSQFDWNLMWFDSLLYTPTPNMAGVPWDIGDITQIPAPEKGSYTALYKAIHKMVANHKQMYLNGIAAGPRDQHIMVIFSDGGDNQSHVDNSSIHEELTNGKKLYWERNGAPTTSLAEIKQDVASVPNLRTFVIGFGDKADAQSLKDIAASGKGEYFYGSSSANLDQIFHDVQAEFVTLQTLGAEIPLPPKSYVFSLLVKHLKSNAEGRKDFTLEVGPNLGTCTKTAPTP